jgi:hypothetical protein
MLYDIDTRMLVARERSELLRRDAAPPHRQPRTRRWLADRLIAAAFRISPEAHPRPALHR